MLYMSYADDLDCNCLLNDMPTARLIGTGKVPGRLVASFFMTIVPCATSTVPVVVWDLDEYAMRELRAAHNSALFLRRRLRVTLDSGEKVVATAYTLREDVLSPARPPEKYLEKMRRGYGQHRFDTSPIDQALAAVPH